MATETKYRCVCEHTMTNGTTHKRGEIITASQYANSDKRYWVKVLEDSVLDAIKAGREKMVNQQTIITK